MLLNETSIISTKQNIDGQLLYSKDETKEMGFTAAP